mmetsp:Transcript_944/g.3363  ORF Transcript_944/g.3363 Transcript_944/m.3363 type:complete len:523 (+) Transcript_944:3-1571(+)
MTSLGCARNWVDSELMLGSLLQAGLEPTDDAEEADVIVVNTCGFLEAARAEGRGVIDDLGRRKKAGAALIVAGCMVNLNKDRILADHPLVDGVIGAGAVDKINAVVGEVFSRKRREGAFEQVADLGSARSYLAAGEVPRRTATPRHFAYLKIAEGCKKNCGFCIIPAIKGRLRSKPRASVVREAKALLAAGARELVLIAQDLGDYGKDLADGKADETKADLAAAGDVSSMVASKAGGLLAQLLRDVLDGTAKSPDENESFWIRLLYLYPDEVTPDLVDLIRQSNEAGGAWRGRILPYVDMPIQHVNDDVLRAMRRATTGDTIRGAVHRLKADIPGLALRTSLMVGHPGETEAAFRDLLDFVGEGLIDHLGVFVYSPEKGSASYRLHAAGEGIVPLDVAETRRDALVAAQLQVVRARHDALVGTEMDVVVEAVIDDDDGGRGPQLVLRGRHAGQAPDDVDGGVLLSVDVPKRVSRPPQRRGALAPRQRAPELHIEIGGLYRAVITGHRDFDLVGRLVEQVPMR